VIRSGRRRRRRRSSIFGDDDLRYEVKEGSVRVHGTVDNQAEREELERRIRRVPGVRDVDMSGVGLGT
jgi:osmotically-inducible protein OsmY